ncbi:NADH dehydrogenase I chain K [Thermoplasma volcanium GSS1]|uniref:NADH dehydrogenase I chain K n=1 Tax=Thermoplasma volcanium (strain ATCC 51530 / DSM 4299 / JCM 9571 / NBRC 15438 / GSS1) TaxID=273116 RepID=Q979N1_THEVO|nr:NuoM family protein [Thermoplasma volcanium]BAB60271.1 NADH dehydrogenase I chain K [Thermoplasma volcanium GSS1]
MFALIILISAIIFGIISYFTGKHAKEVSAVLSGILLLEIIAYSIMRFSSYSGGFISRYSVVISSSLGLSFSIAVSGLTDALLILSAVVILIAVLITDRNYGSAFFGLEMTVLAGLIGLLISRDFLFFYIFWEVVLIPVYFMIGRYGIGNKNSISLKFFVYTHIGSVFILLSIFTLYSQSYVYLASPTFEIGPLMSILPKLSLFYKGFVIFGFLFGFLVKMPSFPIHSWLPDSYYSAPYPGSVILAGAISMMGGYGLFGIMIESYKALDVYVLYLLIALGIISLIYFALTAMFQRNIKKMMAFASASAMGFVTISFAASILETSGIDYSVRALEAAGGMFQIVAHGLIMSLVFSALYYISRNTKTDSVYGLGGIYREAPKLASLTLVGLLASLGLPGFAGFIGEFSIVVGVFQTVSWYIFLIIFGMIITASYHIWTAQRSLYGPYNENLGFIRDINSGEFMILIFLVLVIFVLGIYPNLIFANLVNYTNTSLSISVEPALRTNVVAFLEAHVFEVMQ